MKCKYKLFLIHSDIFLKSQDLALNRNLYQWTVKNNLTHCLFFLQLPALPPSWWWTLHANQTTSQCPGRPLKAQSPTWQWLKMNRAAGGRVTPAAPAAKYLVCSVGNSTMSTLSVLMTSVLEPRVTWRRFALVICLLLFKALHYIHWFIHQFQKKGFHSYFVYFNNSLLLLSTSQNRNRQLPHTWSYSIYDIWII